MDTFINWWQHLPEQISPVIFSLGGFSLRWYGMMYLVAFLLTYLLVRHRIKSEKLSYPPEFLGDAILWAVVGVMVGGRLGYVIFYNLEYFIQHPLRTISPFAKIGNQWQFVGISGMAYHGGLIGVIVAWFIFAKKNQLSFFKMTDLFASSVPLGYTFGRIGNFINGELYGRVTTASIGMYFPGAESHQLRHPSQLYEAFFEGIFLFIILWSLRKKSPFIGFLTGLYIFGYGFVRFFIEFFREPDAHLGFVFLKFSMGQILCFAMMGVGVIIWIYGYKTFNNKGKD